MPADGRRVHRRRVPRHLLLASSRRVRHHDHQQDHGGTGRFPRPDRLPALPGRSRDPACAAGPLRVIGLYVPSRDASADKTERKRKWLAACDAALASAAAGTPLIVAGDLNILEPGHQPRYPFFAPFEYDFYQALAGHARPDRRVPAPAPTRHRVQLGRPDRRRLPVRPRLLLPPSPRPDHRLPLPAPAPPGQTLGPLGAHDPLQPDPAPGAARIQPRRRSRTGNALLRLQPHTEVGEGVGWGWRGRGARAAWAGEKASQHTVARNKVRRARGLRCPIASSSGRVATGEHGGSECARSSSSTGSKTWKHCCSR